MGCFFSFPELKNNLIYYKFILICKPNFHINSLLSIKFNSFKINSIIQHFENTLNLEFFKKYFLIDNFTFKNNFFTRNYNCSGNVFKEQIWDFKNLPENIFVKKYLKISREIYLKWHPLWLLIEFDKLDKNSVEYTHTKNQVDLLSKKNKENDLILEYWQKKDNSKFLELLDLHTLAKFEFQEFCVQFHTFNYNLEKGLIIYTNFATIAGGFVIKPSENNNIEVIDHPLTLTGLSDIINNNSVRLGMIDNSWYQKRYFHKD